MKSDNMITRYESETSSRISRDRINNLVDRKEKIVLVGNPNVGKSIFFNHLSGMYVDVSNFPGTTVAISKANYKDSEVYDTPGIYGVSSFNDEEKVARDMILDADIVLNVVNSLNLDRDLFLTLQLIEMGKKVTVLLNFADELKKKNIKVDAKKLSDWLGVEVIETSAINETGFDRLDYAIENAKKGKEPLDLQFMLHQVQEKGCTKPEALLILEGDEYISEKRQIPCGTLSERDKIYIERRNRVQEIVQDVEHEDTKKGEFLSTLGRLSLNPLTGIPILMAVLVAVYFFIGDFISQRVVDYTENQIGVNIFEYNVKSFVANYTPSVAEVEITGADDAVIDNRSFEFTEGMNANPGLANEFNAFSSREGASTTFHFKHWLPKLFFGEFGIITMTVTYLVFLLLPLVLGFYFVMAMLEDSGYLPRLATMLDRAFNKVGLNGRAVIPIMLGFGCVTMANVTTRLLGTDREKTIVTAILQFVIPCSAQLAVIAVLMSGAGIVPLLIYIATIGTVLISLSTILNNMLPGESSPLLLDLSAMRIPQMKNVLRKTMFRTWGFMKEAGFWFFVGAAGVGVMQVTGLLNVWQDLLKPLVNGWLELPPQAATAFVMGMVRRDFGAAGLFDMSLTIPQITVAIITITLFVPCIASFVVMLKERGWKEGLSVWFGTWITAFLIGGIIAKIII